MRFVFLPNKIELIASIEFDWLERVRWSKSRVRLIELTEKVQIEIMFDYGTNRTTIRPIEFDWFLVRFVRLATEPESKPQEFKRWSIHARFLVIFLKKLRRHSRQNFALKKLFEGTSVKRRYVSTEFNCRRISEMASMFCWEATLQLDSIVCLGDMLVCGLSLSFLQSDLCLTNRFQSKIWEW